MIYGPFYSEDIFHVFNEVYAHQVKGKVYRLLFEMNRNTKIKVRTPVGCSKSADTGPIIMQGSVEAAILSMSMVGIPIYIVLVLVNKTAKHDTICVGLKKDNY